MKSHAESVHGGKKAVLQSCFGILSFKRTLLVSCLWKSLNVSELALSKLINVYVKFVLLNHDSANKITREKTRNITHLGCFASRLYSRLIISRLQLLEKCSIVAIQTLVVEKIQYRCIDFGLKIKSVKATLSDFCLTVPLIGLRTIRSKELRLPSIQYHLKPTQRQF